MWVIKDETKMRSQSVDTMKKRLNWKLSTLHLYITNRTHTTQNWHFLTKTHFLDVVFILTFTYSRKDLSFSWTNMKKNVKKYESWVVVSLMVKNCPKENLSRWAKDIKNIIFSIVKKHLEKSFLVDNIYLEYHVIWRSLSIG